MFFFQIHLRCFSTRRRHHRITFRAQKHLDSSPPELLIVDHENMPTFILGLHVTITSSVSDLNSKDFRATNKDPEFPKPKAERVSVRRPGSAGPQMFLISNPFNPRRVEREKARPPEVPEGRPIIAHRVNGGLRNEIELVPSGTKESYPREPWPKIAGIERRRLNSAGFREKKARRHGWR
jgi:hypothetical protein